MKHLPLILILSGIAFAIITRFVLPFPHVFSPLGIQLNTPDAYIMIRYADMFPYGIAWDWYSNWPDGQQPFHYTVFSFIIWSVSRIFNISTMQVGAILPPLIFLLTLMPVYAIARVLFNKMTAAVSVFALCLLPGEILHRTMLGAADYHCWEILLVSSYFAFLIYAIKSRTWFSVVAAAITFAIYCLSWQGAPIILLILAISCLIVLFLLADMEWKAIIGFGTVALTGLCAKLLPEISPMHWYEFTGLFSLDLAQPVTEMQSLFFTSGQFDMSVMFTYFGFTFWIALAGIGWMAYRVYKSHDTADIVFLAWSCVMLAITICMRRFDYYFAVNGAILAAFVVVKVIQYTGRQQAIRAAIVVALVLCLPLAKQSIMTGISDTGYMSPGWQKAVIWLQNQANDRLYYDGERPEYAVLSWWNNGYWITGAGHHAVTCDTGNQDNAGKTARLLMDDYSKSIWALRHEHIKYVIIDKAMMTSSLYPIMRKADVANPSQSFMQQIYNTAPDWQFDEVKVYMIY